MKVKVMILLFQIMAISNLKQASAKLPDGYVTENVAVFGKATQSKLTRGLLHWAALGNASNAIDGKRDPDLYNGSCSYTVGSPPWWRVDLLRTYTIVSVNITNRGDCCAERITGAGIRIGDSLANNGIYNPLCGEIGEIPAGETRTIPCRHLIRGRYVTVYLPEGPLRILHICEVEVDALVPEA